MEADNPTNRSTRHGTRWDFTAVDAAPDPQSFVRYLEQRHSQPSSYPRTLAMRALEAGVLTPEEAQEAVSDWQRRAEQQDYLEFGVFFTPAGSPAPSSDFWRSARA